MGLLQAISPNVSNPFGYENCDQEQIHLLGHIQSHGILIGINELDLTIAQISDNTIEFFNIPASSLIEQPLSILFPEPQIDILVSFLSRKDLEIFNPTKITIQIEQNKYLFQGIMHRSDGLLILELEPLPTDSDSSLSFYHLAKSAAANVRQAKDFAEMSGLLVQEIRKITQCDRVMIYRFEPDNSGIVIAEAKDEQIESFLGLHFPADDIPELARKLYYKNWLRQIVDVNSHPVPIVPLNNPITQEPIDLSFSTLRSVSPIHIKYLQKMGVSASFSISLISAGKLWGLIACHHFFPQYIDYEARKACEFLAQVMSIEIVSRYEQELKTAQEKIKIVQAKLKQNILGAKQSINQIFSQNADSLLDLVNAQGVAICLSDRISKIGTCPPQKFISSLVLWLETKSEDVFHTNCLSCLYPEAQAVKDIASGILAISISLNHTSYHIIWFRCEVIQTVDWAGDPNKLALDDEWELNPQRSFELWKETVKAKSLPWDEVEIETASELRSTLMLAALEFSQRSLKLEAERAQVASQAKSSFLARMSHELRTPLNAILGCTQLMNLDNSLTQAIGEYVNIISYSSEHLLCLIDDILEMSKIEAGKIVLAEVQFDFHLFLHNLREMMQIKAKDKDLQLIFAVHPNSPQYIKADERKLRQILLNLLGNAIKFTDKGYVLLRVFLMDQEEASSKAIIHFELEDSGRGIAPEEIDNLFEAFVQTSSGKESQTGTGLGLAISQQFAQCMGGYISASSTLNKGTVFQFDLEVEQLSYVESDVEIEQSQIAISLQPAIKITEESSKQDLSNSLRILLVEDTAYNQIIALKFLEKLGYQADLAVNGLEVLKALEYKFYDLILMDIQMPEMDGLETTRRIRLKEKETMAINKVKIVAMTANTMSEDRENCIQIGMDDFIGKPIRINELDALLQKFSSKQTAINL
jgi:light-regulated signal transduction histidine kinase (bacteriophytochrome)/CheY-like chemotaxis protein